MQGKFICSICRKNYNDLHNYINCVTSCYEKKLKEEKEAENAKKLEEINALISKVKAAEKYLIEVKAEFKEKYPEEYELNFGKKDNYDDKIIKPGKTAGLGRIGNAELTYAKNGNDKPKITAKVNGKDVSTEKLFDDPDTRYIAKMLGLL